MSPAAGVVGRDGVLARLRRVLDRGGGAAAVVVRGEAGMGKSTVLDSLVTATSDAGLPVRCEVARELQQDVPFALLADLLVGSGREGGSMGPLQSLLLGLDGEPTVRADPRDRVLAVTEAVSDLVMAEAAETPSVLVVDDLHWADRPSLLVLDRLLRRAPQLGLRVVAAMRPSERVEVQAIIDRAGEVGHGVVDLAPLGPAEAAAVVAAVVGGRPGPHLVALADGAAGNPLYLAELARSAVAAGLQRDGEVVDLPGPAAPPSLRGTVLTHLATLPEVTLRTLQVAAVLGASIDVALLAELVDGDPLAVVADLRPAVVAGLVVDHGGTPAFRHDVVRAALYEDLPVSARAALHRRAAGALPSPPAAAAHLAAAGPPYADRDLEVVEVAAEAALKTDARRSAELLELILAHLPTNDRRRLGLRVRHARALVFAGELDAAHDALEALERDGHDADLDVGLALLDAQGARDQPDADLVRRLQVQAMRVTDAARRLEAQGRLAFHGVRADAAGFRWLLAELPDDGPHLPVDTRVHLLLARAQQHWTDSDTVTACDVAVRAQRIAHGGGASAAVAMLADLVRGRIAGDHPTDRGEAIAALQEVTRRAERTGHATMAVMAHAALANILWIQGEWDEAEAAYGACALAAEEADVPRTQAEALGWLALITADRGDIERAQAHYRAWARLGWRTESRPASIESRIAYAAGHDGHAIAAWTADLADPLTIPFSKAITALQLSVAAMAAGDRASLAVAAEHVANDETTGMPMALLRPAILAALDGDVDTAVAVADRSRFAPTWGFAKMAELVGLTARDAGDVETAVQWLREAHDVWERCGAVALRRRNASWLRAMGVRTRGRIADRPVTGWGSLTDAERRVVDEVAKGIVYREIGERLHISRRTVETHVGNAMRKLEVANRSQLAAEHARRAATG